MNIEFETPHLVLCIRNYYGTMEDGREFTSYLIVIMVVSGLKTLKLRMTLQMKNLKKLEQVSTKMWILDKKII